jgi:hypothetical protein
LGYITKNEFTVSGSCANTFGGINTSCIYAEMVSESDGLPMKKQFSKVNHIEQLSTLEKQIWQKITINDCY